MIEVSGVKVFGDINTPEIQKALNQFLDFRSGHEDTIIDAALMPDAHFGYGVPIGGVFASKGMVFPSAVGFDIGCGMCAVPTNFHKDDISNNAEKIWEKIQKLIPVGFNHHTQEVAAKNKKIAEELVAKYFEME